MSEQISIRLLVEDASVLAALRFALTIDGFVIIDSAFNGTDRHPDAPLVIDERYAGDGLIALSGLRARGCRGSAMVLATNPTARFRARVAALDAILIEKPLIGDDLGRTLISASGVRKAA